MDEILASIRRIIAEEPTGPAKSVAMPLPSAPVPPPASATPPVPPLPRQASAQQGSTWPVPAGRLADALKGTPASAGGARTARDEPAADDDILDDLLAAGPGAKATEAMPVPATPPAIEASAAPSRAEPRSGPSPKPAPAPAAPLQPLSATPAAGLRRPQPTTPAMPPAGQRPTPAPVASAAPEPAPSLTDQFDRLKSALEAAQQSSIARGSGLTVEAEGHGRLTPSGPVAPTARQAPETADFDELNVLIDSIESPPAVGQQAGDDTSAPKLSLRPEMTGPKPLAADLLRARPDARVSEAPVRGLGARPAMPRPMPPAPERPGDKSGAAAQKGEPDLGPPTDLDLAKFHSALGALAAGLANSQSPTVAEEMMEAAAQVAAAVEVRVEAGEAAVAPATIATVAAKVEAPAPVVPAATAAPSSQAPGAGGTPVDRAATTPAVAASAAAVVPPAPKPEGMEPSAPAASAPRSFEDAVAEMLRPMLRQWLDANMPGLVEKALKAEGLDPGKPRPGGDKAP